MYGSFNVLLIIMEPLDGHTLTQVKQPIHFLWFTTIAFPPLTVLGNISPYLIASVGHTL